MPSFSRSTLSTDVLSIITGTISTTDFNTMANKGVMDVISDIDLRSTIRRTVLAPNLFDEIWQYTCPTDLKADKIIDIQPQIKRGRFDEWTLTTPEEFDRKKEDRRVDRFGDPIDLKNTQWLGENLCAISSYDFVRKILISRPIDDDEIVISELDSVGNWTGFGDGTNLTRDTDDYVKESASLNWDINAVGGTTAGIVNTALSTFDISEYKTTGSIFVWAYISSATNITNFIIRIGSDSSNYYSMTATTTNEGTSFVAGWNLLRFDFSGKSTTGTPDDDACDYVALYMTKSAAKVSETDYRFDWLVMKKGEHYYLHYYSKYGWQSATGTYKEKSTDDTDLLNVDTDEYNLIVTKVSDYCQRFILKQPSSMDFKTEYEEKKAKYILENPSRAMLLTQEYFFR